MAAKGWMVWIVLLQLIVLLIFLWVNPEAVGHWRARACVAEEMVYGVYLYEAAQTGSEAQLPEPLKTSLDPENMARETAYNVCSIFLLEEHWSSIEEK